MLKMHWLLVRSSMIKFILYYRELGSLGIVFDVGQGCCFVSLFLFSFFCVFILPPAEGAEAEQAPVFHLKQNNKTCAELDHSFTFRSPLVSFIQPVVDQNLLLLLLKHPKSVSNLDPVVNMQLKFRMAVVKVKSSIS